MSHLSELCTRRQETSHRQGAHCAGHYLCVPETEFLMLGSNPKAPQGGTQQTLQTKEVSSRAGFATGLMQKSQKQWSV